MEEDAGFFNDRKPIPQQKSESYQESFYQFLMKNDSKRLIELIGDPPEKAVKHYAISVSYIEACAACPLLANHIITFPSITLPACDDAATRAVGELAASNNKATRLKGSKIHVRFYDPPDTVGQDFVSFKDFKQFTCVRGTVTRATAKRRRDKLRFYKCKTCKNESLEESKVENYYALPNTLRKCKTEGCEGENLNMIEKMVKKSAAGSDPDGDKKADLSIEYGEITVQEHAYKNWGKTPRSVVVILENDLAGNCKPGDDVEICGTVSLRWKPCKPGQEFESELILIANHVIVNNDKKTTTLNSEEVNRFVKDFWKRYEHDPYRGLNVILSSFCPKIYGMYLVKLACLMVLAGGVRKEVHGTKIRGESHLLMVGDPGTGKSQIMKFVANLSQRSVVTTGIGTTHAGLTVAAAKGEGGWHFEPGALVLADGGVCCIDEFSCMREHDRTSIHEAMEQQSISIAKAGMVSRMRTRCTIVASTNPKGKYDPKHTLPMNIGLASPLLSRFDIILVLSDAADPLWDDFACNFKLKGKIPAFPGQPIEKWNVEMLRNYLVYIKTITPELTKDANDVLGTYYSLQRKSDNRTLGRTTVRLLESLVRLSQGHARIMNRSEVILHDAITAVMLVEMSMQGSSLLGLTDILHTQFPEDPMKEYRSQAQRVLERLDLKHLWEKEELLLNRQYCQRSEDRGEIEPKRRKLNCNEDVESPQHENRNSNLIQNDEYDENSELMQNPDNEEEIFPEDLQDAENEEEIFSENLRDVENEDEIPPELLMGDSENEESDD